jgi:hypothetical protein
MAIIASRCAISFVFVWEVTFKWHKILATGPLYQVSQSLSRFILFFSFFLSCVPLHPIVCENVIERASTRGGKVRGAGDLWSNYQWWRLKLKFSREICTCIRMERRVAHAHIKVAGGVVCSGGGVTYQNQVSWRHCSCLWDMLQFAIPLSEKLSFTFYSYQLPYRFWL